MSDRRWLTKALAALCVLVLARAAGAAYPSDWAHAACDRIAGVYSQCGPKFAYDRHEFTFATASGPRAVHCHDGRDLAFYERLERMNIASIFMIPYRPGQTPLPEKRRNWDPGRLRSEELLKSVYGESEAEVRARLVEVEFLGQKVRFQKELGAAAALARAGRELSAEAKRDATLAKFLAPFTSKKIDLRLFTFHYRKVKGTERLSTHSFGTGIDLNTNVGAQYWLWDETRANPDKAKQGEGAYVHDHYVPQGTPAFHPKAVAIFEKNGFIWGGKWNHYDTMHFEYRPEFFDGVRIECPAE